MTSSTTIKVIAAGALALGGFLYFRTTSEDVAPVPTTNASGSTAQPPGLGPPIREKARRDPVAPNTGIAQSDEDYADMLAAFEQAEKQLIERGDEAKLTKLREQIERFKRARSQSPE